LLEFIRILPEDISINLHLFSDGRDTAPTSFLGYLQDFLEKIKNRANIKIASISGRYYAMDRDTNWDRNQKAYEAIMGNNSPSYENPLDWVQANYDNGMTDEFLNPVSFKERDLIEDNEVIVLLNFRSDRAKQLARIFTDSDFVGLKRMHLENLVFATMTRYYPEFSGTVFIEDKKPSNILGEILERNNIPQLHIAETEKFAHVTKFFNG
jgi:2,3-bisphosphoglycerate-independent phosphoglycerate mutase